MKLQNYLVKISTILFLICGPIYSQVLCDVSLDLKNIPSSEREILNNFASDIKTYIESNNWTAEDLGDDKINCSIQIFITSASENKYSAQLFIGSFRPIFKANQKSKQLTALLRLFDDKWEFLYIKGQSLIRNETRHDQLTSLIDFYIYLLIGFDFDSFKSLAGTPYFEKSLSIANLAPRSGKGWERSIGVYNRSTFIEELLNPDYHNFRKSFYSYHRRGLDWFATKKLDGQKNIISIFEQAKIIKTEVNPRSQILKTFFDTKYLEVVESLKDYEDKTIIPLLGSVDPAHQLYYEQIAKKKL
ncbi:MAG: DUF4835 family protein [Bacteroidetes bacterium]|nr:DUF4835 family protein [Bacteroidota bacterium]